MLEVDTRLHRIPLVSYVLLMYPEKNARLNKAEMLICLKESSDRRNSEETKIVIHTIMETLQRAHNMRIDTLHWKIRRSLICSIKRAQHG